jgi:tRNA(Ile2) C34 agmatinyltransferase TiaS
MTIKETINTKCCPVCLSPLGYDAKGHAFKCRGCGTALQESALKQKPDMIFDDMYDAMGGKFFAPEVHLASMTVRLFQ